MIGFSRALPLFAILQVLIYIILLLMSDKKNIENGILKIKGRVYILSSIPISILSTTTASLVFLTDFRETIPYYILLIVITAWIILAASNANTHLLRGIILLNIIMWHIDMIFYKLPPTGISATEGTEMVAHMMKAKHWEYSYAHNPSYNPFPTVAFIYVSLNYLTSMPWYYIYIGLTFSFSLMIAYDLVIYALTKEITGSYMAGMLAILFVALTPEINIRMHPYQWSGNLLVLIIILMFIKIFRRSSPLLAGLALIILAFTSAILTHTTAASAVLFPLIAVFIAYILKFLFKFKNREIVNIIFGRRIFTFTFIFFMVLTFARSIYVYGYFNYIWPMINHFIVLFFLSENREAGGGSFAPLYDKAGISFLQAYSWSLAIAMATACIIYILIRRKINTWHIILYATSATFIALGYIVAVFSRSIESTAIYRGTYVAIPLLFPLASTALTRTLKANKAIALVSLFLIIFSVPIAAHDPMISPLSYAKTKGGMIELTSADMIEAREINALLPQVDLHNLGVHSKIIKLNQITAAFGARQIYVDRLKSALDLLWFINLEPKHNITIVLSTSETLSYSLIYNSGRSQLFLTPILNTYPTMNG